MPPLHLAAQSGSTSSVSLLLRAGAEVNACVANRATSELGKLISKTTALDLAMQGRHSAVVRLLEQAGGTQGSLLPDSVLEEGRKSSGRLVYAQPAGSSSGGGGILPHTPAPVLAAVSTVLAVAALSTVLRSSASDGSSQDTSG